MLQDEIIKWEPYVKGEPVRNRFTLEEWNFIAADILSDDEWDDFIYNFPQYIKCYILKRLSNDDPIAMIYLFNEDNQWQTVSIHGGGWGNNSHLFYRGYILMIESLILHGVQVKTSCNINNLVAYRFSSSVGFTTYQVDDNNYYMEIHLEDLRSSKMYLHFSKNKR